MKTAFLFSGQGAQYPGMMRDLFDAEPEARRVFSCADAYLGRDISGLCFGGTQADLNLTHNTQPCLLAADLAAARALQSHGAVPSAVAGFSLGEYAALEYSGVISERDAFELVQARADAMQAAVASGIGAMAALVGASAAQVEALCASAAQGYVAAANYNSPSQTVISGEAAAVREVVAAATAQGVRAVMLAVSAPFHCAMMEPAARALETLFKAREFCAPQLPVYMNVDGRPLRDAAAAPRYLALQATSPVRWVDTLENMRADGVDVFIECGPGKTLSGLVRKTLKGVKVLHVEDVKTLQATLAELNL